MSKNTCSIRVDVAYDICNPFLKYPANPPTVGESDTVMIRAILFVSFIAISGLGLLHFTKFIKNYKIEKFLHLLDSNIHHYCIFLMPENPDEITAPMDLVDGFRGASFVAVSIYWLTLGLILGGFLKNLKNDLI